MPWERTTKQRTVILEELRKMPTHPTADELHERVRRRLPKVSLGTVYRTLEKLSRAGIVRVVGQPGSQRRFDATGGDHGHIRCIRCGRVDDLDGPADVGADDEGAARRLGYEVLERHVDLVGICRDCREKEERDGS
jgi:Fur family transcriptional regulator, ferric uptake regulator